MQDMDTVVNSDQFTGEEEDLFMEHVVGDDHELLYLDSYLRELFAK